VTNSVGITSATKLTDASGKGVVCLDLSVTVNNIQASGAVYSPTSDPANGTLLVVTGGIQSLDPASACPVGTDAWIQTFGADLHRQNVAGTVYVSFQ
jgi:hypothetical protein